MAGLVTVAKFDAEMEANLAKALLEGSGLSCVLVSGHLDSVRRTQELQVPEDEAEAAGELLREHFPQLFAAQAPPRCPQCGGTEIVRPGRLLVLVVLLGMFAPFIYQFVSYLAEQFSFSPPSVFFSADFLSRAGGLFSEPSLPAALLLIALFVLFFLFFIRLVRLQLSTLLRCKRCGHSWKP